MSRPAAGADRIFVHARGVRSLARSVRAAGARARGVVRRRWRRVVQLFVDRWDAGFGPSTW